MLKKVITYEDFNGETVSETFYFNLSSSELVEMEVEYEYGFEKYIEAIFEAKNNKEIIAQFKKIILMSYGEKSPDGKRFIKSETSRNEFAQTAAYESLFMEMITDEAAAAAFIKGILPKSLANQAPAPPSEEVDDGEKASNPTD